MSATLVQLGSTVGEQELTHFQAMNLGTVIPGFSVRGVWIHRGPVKISVESAAFALQEPIVLKEQMYPKDVPMAPSLICLGWIVQVSAHLVLMDITVSSPTSQSQPVKTVLYTMFICGKLLTFLTVDM